MRKFLMTNEEARRYNRGRVYAVLFWILVPVASVYFVGPVVCDKVYGANCE
jgi:hypothetical protein